MPISNYSAQCEMHSNLKAATFLNAAREFIFILHCVKNPLKPIAEYLTNP